MAGAGFAGAGLRVAAAGAALLALVALATIVARTLALGRKPYLAQERGNAAHGILYAFGPGMLPWAKASAAEHVPTYLAGVLYHVGILAALAVFVLRVLGGDMSPLVRAPAAALLAAGLAAGIVLLARRAGVKNLRAISVPDDFAGNMLTDLFVAAALVATIAPAATPFFLLVAVAFFLYLPLGKVRHCVFFFVSRIFFGAHFGRRGVFPPPGRRRAPLADP